MDIKTRTQIGADLDFVSRMLVDYDFWLARAQERGARIGMVMTHDDGAFDTDISFTKRGSVRDVQIFVKPQGDGHFAITWHNRQLGGEVALKLTALGAQTLMQCTVTLIPQTASAKVVLAGFSLARGVIEDKVTQRIARIAALIQSRYERAPIK